LFKTTATFKLDSLSDFHQFADQTQSCTNCRSWFA